MPAPESDARPGSILILTQGHAGDRLGARLVPALRRRFPDRALLGLGGDGMAGEGVRIVARTVDISAMGWTGLLPRVPRILAAIRAAAAGTRKPVPACVVAVDVWQPLRFLHRRAPHLAELPHVCYLPPGPNFIGATRVHTAAARQFAAIITPFPHQERLYREAGGRVVPGGHAGLRACREEHAPLPAAAREEVLAILPGSRALEIRSSLGIQLAAADRVRSAFPRLNPVVCCAGAEAERLVARLRPGVRVSRNAPEVLARARFAVICSGTAALEAAVLGCPGVVTYHGSALQRWEWRTFHVPRLARLRAEGIASPYVALPNIIAGAELYPERLSASAEEIAAAVLGELARDAEQVRARLDGVVRALDWSDAGETVAAELERALAHPRPDSGGRAGV